VHLTKHHGLGNDFLVALVDSVPQDGAGLARSWCHRTHGIGADGLIFGTAVDGADLRMTLFNSDGSRAEISGNGIRCLAQAAFATSADATTMDIVTDGGTRRIELVAVAGPEAQIAVDMGPVGPGPGIDDTAALVRPGFEIGHAATGAVGNPHVVIEVEDLDVVDPHVDGPAIEALWKPEGINVHFLKHLGGDAIQLVHWERGAGVTQACGSGAAVSATLAHQWGLTGVGVDVMMPGGRASVAVGESATLTGPAVHVATIEPVAREAIDHG
jgi:diaminopimelate epimerase